VVTSNAAAPEREGKRAALAAFAGGRGLSVLKSSAAREPFVIRV